MSCVSVWCWCVLSGVLGIICDVMVCHVCYVVCLLRVVVFVVVVCVMCC